MSNPFPSDPRWIIGWPASCRFKKYLPHVDIEKSRNLAGKGKLVSMPILNSFHHSIGWLLKTFTSSQTICFRCCFYKKQMDSFVYIPEFHTVFTFQRAVLQNPNQFPSSSYPDFQNLDSILSAQGSNKVKSYLDAVFGHDNDSA